MSKAYHFFDGKMQVTDQGLNLFNNRAFQYGDGVFETMRYHKGRVVFLKAHLNRLIESMHLLMIVPDDRLSYDAIQQAIEALCAKNELTAARIRLQVFRTNGGYYRAQSSSFHLVITCESLVEHAFPLDLPALTVDIYPHPVKVLSPLSNLKSTSAAGYVLASLHAKNHGLDDCFILNSAGRICESTHSNLFIYAKGIFSTPPLSEGCVAGILREQLKALLKEEGLAFEETPLEIQDIEQAEEVFLTNAIRGISSVGSFNARSYKREKADFLQKKLNASVFS